MPLDREEYVEQAYFFQTLRERMQQSYSTQDLLDAIRQEVLTTTMLPYAVDFMAGELRLTGGFATAMARLPHYFTPFQTYVVSEAEKAEGRFDFRIALEILQREVEYRAQVHRRRESSCTSSRPCAATDWVTIAASTRWPAIRSSTRLAGMDPYGPPPGRPDRLRRHDLRAQRALSQEANEGREGDAFWRKGRPHRAGQPSKDPLYLFAALQRHLSYPSVPRPREEDTQRYLLPALQQRVDRMETR